MAEELPLIENAREAKHLGSERPALTLIFRDTRAGNHSIERLFAALEPYLAMEFEMHKVVVPRQPSGFRALWTNIRYARKRVEGLAHVTGDAQYLATFLPRDRTVLTIHDCGTLENLRGWKKFLYKWVWVKLPCRAAARVTVISEATREAVERTIGPIGSKLSVVENCATVAMGRTPRPFNASCPRILQIGSGHHKNLDNLIRAVDGLDCELHIVGRLSEEIRAEMERREIRFKNEFAVSDERLQEIFHEGDILFFASRHEGFGLPILEGNEVGIPVITSNRFSMPWVAGSAAVIVDPESPSEIRTALQRIIGDPGLRRELVRKGFENTKRFSVEAVAEKYGRIYRSLAAQSN